VKFILGIILACAIAATASAQYLQRNTYGLGSSGMSGTGSNSSSHSVQGYTTQSGTYVQPHQQTNSNNTQLDNYGTRGNVNPYTGAVGTRGAHY
jgi:hypothetical protein